MMREMTEGELHAWYRRGRWPCCNASGYRPGPCGGAMQNIQCPRCNTVMNVMNPEDPRFWGMVAMGQMIEVPAHYKPPTIPLLWRIFGLFE